jgi:hypothetical protein
MKQTVYNDLKGEAGIFKKSNLADKSFWTHGAIWLLFKAFLNMARRGSH